MRWFYSAAEQGHTRAQYNLGLCYWTGDGVTRDDQEAVQWLRLAAEKGHAKAHYYLGLAYLDGRGVFADSFEAWEWFTKALTGGYARARKPLQRLPNPQLPARAFEIESGTVWIQGGTILGPQDEVMLYMDLQNKTQRRIWAEVEFQLPEAGEFVRAFKRVKGQDTTRFGWPVDSIVPNIEYPFRISVFDDRRRRKPIGIEESFYYFNEKVIAILDTRVLASKGERVGIVVGFPELTFDGLAAEVPGTLANRALRRDIALSLFAEESKLHKECQHIAVKVEQYGEDDESFVAIKMGAESQESLAKLRARGEALVEKWFVQSCDAVNVYEVVLMDYRRNSTVIFYERLDSTP